MPLVRWSPKKHTEQITPILTEMCTAQRVLARPRVAVALLQPCGDPTAAHIDSRADALGTRGPHREAPSSEPVHPVGDAK